MQAKAEPKVKLVGLLEAMGMALPTAANQRRMLGPSITDTRLPVGFADDEFDDCAEWPDDPGLREAAPAAQFVEAPIFEQRQPPAQDAPGRNQGTWARAHTEPHVLHRLTRRDNARVHGYSVAYYRSEHARATAADGGGSVLEMPRTGHRTTAERRGVPHFDAMGYRGRHRWFVG